LSHLPSSHPSKAAGSTLSSLTWNRLRMKVKRRMY
jgi:hypothetical protein